MTFCTLTTSLPLFCCVEDLYGDFFPALVRIIRVCDSFSAADDLKANVGKVVAVDNNPAASNQVVNLSASSPVTELANE